MVGREGKLRQKADLNLTSKSLDVILGCSRLELVLTPGRKWPGLEITLRTGAECSNSTPKDFFLCFLLPGVKGQSPCLHCGLISWGFGGDRKQADSLRLTHRLSGTLSSLQRLSPDQTQWLHQHHRSTEASLSPSLHPRHLRSSCFLLRTCSVFFPFQWKSCPSLCQSVKALLSHVLPLCALCVGSYSGLAHTIGVFSLSPPSAALMLTF